MLLGSIQSSLVVLISALSGPPSPVFAEASPGWSDVPLEGSEAEATELAEARAAAEGPPQSGLTMLTWGGVSLGTSVLLGVGIGTGLFDAEGSGVLVVGAVTGIVASQGLGVGLLIGGVRKNRRWRAWRQAAGRDAPRYYAPAMLSVGATALVSGSIATAYSVKWLREFKKGGALWEDQVREVALTSTIAVVGLGLTVAGIPNQIRWARWKRHPVSLSPSAGWSRQGTVLAGVRGRF